MKKGMLIVFMGTDGSGKSTILNEIEKKYYSSEKKMFTEHWRPNLLPKLNRRNVNDYQTSKENQTNCSFIVSNLRLIYYFFDFILGYVFKIRPILKKGHDFYIERYYYDQLVHPERYGFKNSKLLRVLTRFVPKPSLVLVFTCNPELAFRRKREFTIKEIKEKQNKYLSLAKFLDKVTRIVVINTEEKLDQTIKKTIKKIEEVSEHENRTT